MSEKIIHSFEAGRRGKPDELDTNIANLIAAEFLDINPDARFDIRVSGGYSLEEDRPRIRVSGEVSDFVLRTDGLESCLTEIITSHYNDVHRTNLEPGDIKISYQFKPQASSLALNGHAGDSGNPIAVAYRQGPHTLPWERFIAVALRDFIDASFQNGGAIPTSMPLRDGCRLPLLKGLKADGKVSIDAQYEGARFLGLQNIVIAVEHEPRLDIGTLRQRLGEEIVGYLRLVESQYNASLGKPHIVINGLGPWHTGGWKVDEGSREAKPYRDGFASYGCCEDSFGGEDPSKPSGTGTFLARYIAVNIVAAGLADFARVALTYTIGREEVGLNVTTQNTARVSQEELHAWVRDKFPLRINDAIELFGLKNPELYRQFARRSDYFQGDYPWNRTCT